VDAPPGGIRQRRKRRLVLLGGGGRRDGRRYQERPETRHVRAASPPVEQAHQSAGLRRIQSTCTLAARVATKRTASATSAGRSMARRGTKPGRLSGSTGSQREVSVAP